MNGRTIRVLGIVALGLVAAAGCASSNGDGSNDSAQAMSTTLGSFTVIDADEDGVPTFIAGNLGAAPGAQNLHQAALKSHVVAMAPHFHANASNLVLKRVHKDEIGDVHYRYGQTKNGREVIGAELLLHVRNGAVYAANGTVRDDLTLPSDIAQIAHVDAAQAAEQASPRVSGIASKTAPDLAYLQQGTTLILVYKVELTGTDPEGTPVRDTVLVDAATGVVAARASHIHTAENREVHNTHNSGNLPGATERTEGAGPASDSAVNGNYDNLGNTYSCYKQLFGRDSYDNAGAKFVSSVHYSTNYNNAYWDGSQMVYGDGDGVKLANLAITIDVTAHELTHAVTESTSGLIYYGESGGLNESMSDIFGNTCEWFAAGMPATPPPGTWLVGEECWTPATPGDALRYMLDPAKDGKSLDYYPDYSSGVDVHYSSGISNLVFYLLAHGGSHPRGKTSVVVPGIGIDKASHVFYRANTSLFTSSTNFKSARTATEQAATQLGYDADVVAAVSAAWAAVGVGTIAQPDGGVDSGHDSGPDANDAGHDGGDGGSDGGTCAHGLCSQGGALSSSCDPCVTKICRVDSYCCSKGWDRVCVKEVGTICHQSCN